MIKYLLDTNICIYIMNQRPRTVIEKFKQFEIGQIGVSAITVSELRYGAWKSGNRKRNQNRVDEFLAPLDILPYDQTATDIYGKIRHDLSKNGLMIGPLDLLIAAHALSLDLILVTNNEKEFQRIKHLKIENWAD